MAEDSVHMLDEIPPSPISGSTYLIGTKRIHLTAGPFERNKGRVYA